MRKVGIVRRWAAALCASALLLMPIARRQDARASGTALDATGCVGAPDGTSCPENGDGCFYNDGLDRCLAGVCASPPPCAKTTFTPLPGGNVRMEWAKDPSLVTDGEYCEGEAFVAADDVVRLIGVTPPSEGGVVPITAV
jgi:hypothetical protein